MPVRHRRLRPAPGPPVPGYRLLTPVGFGAGGAVWSALDGAGRPVAVSLVALAPGEGGRTTLRRLGELRTSAHPHLPRVLDVVNLDPGRCALVTEVVPGPSLGTVHAARGGLSPPELATVLGGVGSALGFLHDRGIVHGDVAPRSIIVTAGGAPVLVGLAGEVSHERGTAGFIPPERARGAGATRAADVWSLAQVLAWAAASGTAAPRLLASALSDDPTARPGARDLAAMAHALADPAGIVTPAAADLAPAQLRAGAELSLAGAAPARGPRRRHRRRGTRQVAAVLLGAAALTAAGITVVTLDDETEKGSTSEPAGITQLVSELQRRRDAAIVAGDAAALAELTVPGSSAADADAALISGVRDSGLRVRGLRTDTSAVDLVARAGSEIVVEVRSRQGAYELVPAGTTDPDGEPAPAPTTVAAQDERCVRLVLAGPEPWRVSRTEPCGP